MYRRRVPAPSRATNNRWHFPARAVCCALLVVPVSHATDWRDYGGAPDQSKYAVTPDITRKNVSQLELAWIYPTRRRARLSVQSDHRRQRHVRAGEEQLAGRHRRGHAQGIVDPRQPARHHQSRHQLLGEQGPQRPAVAVRDRRYSAGHRRAHRQIDPLVRQERTGRSERGAGTRSADDPACRARRRRGASSRT